MQNKKLLQVVDLFLTLSIYDHYCLQIEKGRSSPEQALNIKSAFFFLLMDSVCASVS